MLVLAGLGPLGPTELIIILVIVILIFGVGRLPEVGGAIGKSLREFRKSTKDDDTDVTSPPQNASAAPPEASRPAAAPSNASPDVLYCGECGASNMRSNKFCSACGHTLHATVS